jgi:hypothetical protein
MISRSEAAPVLKRYERGVDLQFDLSGVSSWSRLGIDYEDAVFKDQLERARPGQLVIGSNLLDQSFFETEFGGLVRWDITIIEGDTLAGIVEAKRKRHANWERKLLGFSYCLDLFRQDPTLFPSMINSTAGEEVLPPSIIVPDDKDMLVLFRSSRAFQGETARARDCDLIARFGTVPLPG